MQPNQKRSGINLRKHIKIKWISHTFDHTSLMCMNEWEREEERESENTRNSCLKMGAAMYSFSIHLLCPKHMGIHSTTKSCISIKPNRSKWLSFFYTEILIENCLSMLCINMDWVVSIVYFLVALLLRWIHTSVHGFKGNPRCPQMLRRITDTRSIGTKLVKLKFECNLKIELITTDRSI